MTVGPLRPDERGDVVADEIDQGLGGLVLFALGVVVQQLQLHVGQEARAVVDLLYRVGEGAGDGATLPGTRTKKNKEL